MKIYAVLRGFPGLGRVIPGVELLSHFEKKHNACIKISTYFQGESYIKSKGYNTSVVVDEKDTSSVGIISVSKSGERIIEDILSFNPDIVIIDGEPILLHNLKISYPKLQIVSLLNPFDINNPHNLKSSQDFFTYMYSYADLSIVHGLWREEKPTDFKGYISINSIVRDSISTISNSNLSNTIVCLLGGGSKSVNSGFTSGTIEIAKQVIDVAIINKDLSFTIYTSDENIKNEILGYASTCDSTIKNISIVERISDEQVIFSQAKLVIARAGRNTISELITMNMPSIIIPTIANYRGSEQLSNCKVMERSKYPFIRAHYLESGSTTLNDKMLQLINTIVVKNKNNFKPGNNKAVEIIMNTIKNNKSDYLPEVETKFNQGLKQN